MKHKLFITLLLLLIQTTGLFAVKTIITGNIETGKDKTLAVKLTVTDWTNFSNPSTTFQTSAENGNFYFQFDLKKITTAQIAIEGKSITLPGISSLLICPGDELKIFIIGDKQVGFSKLRFEGMGSQNQLFRKKIYSAVNEVYKRQSAPLGKPLTDVVKDAEEQISAMNSAIEENGRMVTDSIRHYTIALQSMAIYETVIIRFRALKEWSNETRQIFTDFIAKNSIVKNVSYGYAAPLISPYANLRNYCALMYAFENDMPPSIALQFSNPIAMIDAINKHFNKNRYANAYIASNYVHTTIIDFGLSQETKRMLDQCVASLPKYNEFKVQIDELINRLTNSIQVGKSFPDFSLMNRNGKMVTNKDLKGKVVVLDFWFSGCAGCRLLTPIMEKIEQKYQGQDIVFVSVSVDKNVQKWKQGIGIYSSRTSEQLYTNGQGSAHPFIKQLFISAFPAMFIIDKNGNFYGAGLEPRLFGVETFEKQLNTALRN